MPEKGGSTALADGEQRRIAEAMFRLLCDRRALTLVARRPVKVWEVAARANVSVEKVKPVVDVFCHRDRPLLVALDESTQLTSQMDLELGHECLIHHWKRLDHWQGRARRFDVFLCHNSQDKPAVREIGKRLRAKGLLPWLDGVGAPPGAALAEPPGGADRGHPDGGRLRRALGVRTLARPGNRGPSSRSSSTNGHRQTSGSGANTTG